MKPATKELYLKIRKMSKSRKFSRTLPLLEASFALIYLFEEIEESDLVNRTKNVIRTFLNGRKGAPESETLTIEAEKDEAQ